MAKAGIVIALEPPPIGGPAYTLGKAAQALRRAAVQVKYDMAEATKTWLPENQPIWEEVGPLLDSQGNLIWEYSTASTPFVYVDQGTAAHMIKRTEPWPKKLRFQSGWLPKTVPGWRAALPGGRFGEFVYPREVYHPGVEPREFTKESAVQNGIILRQRLSEEFVSIYVVR